jgi:hypothetical protein
LGTRPLAEVKREAILRALVNAGFDVQRAALDLRIGKSTLYRHLRRYGLVPPMFSPKGPNAKVPRREFTKRCSAIRNALKEVSEMSKQPSNSYVPNRDQTAGRNNDNPELDKLDRSYKSDKAREGTNSDRTSFDNDGRY